MRVCFVCRLGLPTVLSVLLAGSITVGISREASAAVTERAFLNTLRWTAALAVL